MEKDKPHGTLRDLKTKSVLRGVTLTETSEQLKIIPKKARKESSADPHASHDEKAQDDEDADKNDVNETTQDDEDDDEHDDDEKAQDDDDEEQTESEDDDEEDSNNEIEGTNVEGAKSDEDATYEEDQGNEAVEDTNTNLTPILLYIGLVDTTSVALSYVYYIPSLTINLASTSCTDTPQQNDVAERKHRHLVETARSFLLSVVVPSVFWGESVLTATYVINRIPTAHNSSFSPFEKSYGVLPDYSSLSVFEFSQKLYTSCHVDFLEHISYYYVPASSHNLTQSKLIKVDPFDDVTHEPPPFVARNNRTCSRSTSKTTETTPEITPETTPDTIPETTTSTKIVVDPPPSGQPKCNCKSTKRDDFVYSCYSDSFSSFIMFVNRLHKLESYRDAVCDPLWQVAMAEELAALHQTQTWDLVPLPVDKLAIALEEEVEAMAETMEQYLSKTRTDYGSRVVRPKIEEKDSFKLIGQFLKELRENMYNEDANEHIEKVLKIVDLFHVPNITVDQLMLRVFPISLTEEGKTLEEAYYTQFGGPFQGGGYRAITPGFYQRNNANPSYQERRQSMEDTLSKFMRESAKRHEENSNLIKEIRASTNVAIRNQGASIKTLEIQIEQTSKVLRERGFGSLPSSTKTNPRDQVKSISITIKADSHPIHRIGSPQYVVSTRQNRTLMYETRQTTIPFPNLLNGASISVMPLLTYLNLGLGELARTKLTVELADSIVKYPKGIAENILVRIGKFTFPVDFIILDMPEDIKVPLILGRPFLFAARAKIDVYKRKITLRVREEKIIFKSVKPASSLIKMVYMLSLRERMELDLEARLMEETLVINRSLDPLNGDYIELNEPFELRRNQGDDLMPTIEECEIIEEFRTRDEDLNTGIDDYPSYCDDDKKIRIDCAHNLKFSCMIGFEFTHQKLKGFYKGVLNLGPDYIQNAKTKEWLTRGHISVHEME
ncbi:putative reverse transcriptase domain-containing protein [Tanacetum coccineum]